MHPDELIPVEAIRSRVAELGSEISGDYAGQELVVIGVLLGAIVFVADLVRRLDVPVELGALRAASYGRGTESSCSVSLNWSLRPEVRGRHVLVVEDIVDTGRTLAAVRQRLVRQKPESLAACALLSKPSRRVCDVPVEYCGFTIDDRFVVGYGLDYRGMYRNLPYIGVVNT
jgi:hypoxanthine phosphoribosyltransferase